jgi:hypothetical protein
MTPGGSNDAPGLSSPASPQNKYRAAPFSWTSGDLPPAYNKKRTNTSVKSHPQNPQGTRFDFTLLIYIIINRTFSPKDLRIISLQIWNHQIASLTVILVLLFFHPIL